MLTSCSWLLVTFMERLVKNYYEPNKLLIHIQNRSQSMGALRIRNKLEVFYKCKKLSCDRDKLINSGNHLKITMPKLNPSSNPNWFTSYSDLLKYELSHLLKITLWKTAASKSQKSRCMVALLSPFSRGTEALAKRLVDYGHGRGGQPVF